MAIDKEATGGQVVVKYRYDGYTTQPISPRKIRVMRRDPVISLIRTMLFAGVLSGKWSVEKNQENPDPRLDEIVAFIREQFMPMRLHILRTAICGCFDFGWQPYEKIFSVDTERLMFVLKKLKPLLQDTTEPLTDPGDGSLIGMRQGDVELSIEESLLFNFDVEGTMWKGQSQVELAEDYFDEKAVTRNTAQRYDKKMAGAHWIVKYPIGKSPVPGSDEEVPNHVIADQILDSLESSGLIAIPLARTKLTAMEAKGEQAWSIELVTGDGAVLEFTNRFAYQDKCIARVLGWPERAILEGQFGTKAEAEAHGDFVTTMIEYRHDCVLEQLNWHAVNQLIRYNFGTQYENEVYIQAARLSDASRALMRSVYEAVLNNPDGFLNELDLLDLDSIADQLGIPRKQQQEQPKPEPAPQPEDQLV